MITILNLLAFMAGIIASIPSVYFFKNLYDRNKFYSLMSLMLALTFIFHGLYHLFLGIGDLLLLAEILETLAAFLILVYIIMYTSTGGNSKL